MRHEGAQQSEERGLAGAVGSEESEELPGINAEVYVLQYPAATVRVGEARDQDDRGTVWGIGTWLEGL